MPITPSRLAALASGYFQDAHHASRGGSNEIITVNGRPVPPDRRGGAPSYIHRFSVQGPSHLKGWQHQNMSIGSTAVKKLSYRTSRGGSDKRQHVAPIAPQGAAAAAALSISKRIQFGTGSLDLVLPAADTFVRWPSPSLTISAAINCRITSLTEFQGDW